MKAQSELKKELIYTIDMDMLDDIYEFKYELSGAIDEVIDSIKGLKSVIDVYLPIGLTDCPAKDLMDTQESGQLPF